jgi:hypothetical protein
MAVVLLDLVVANSTAANVGTNSIDSMAGWGGLLGLTIVACVLLLLAFNYPAFKRVNDWLAKIGNTFKYALRGTAVAFVGVCVWALFAVVKTAGEGITLADVVTWVAVVIAGYAGLTGLGWVSTKVYLRLEANHKRVKRGVESGKRAK